MNTAAERIPIADLAARIDMLSRALPHWSLARVAYAVDDIRREACAARLDTLARLASHLERALGTSGGTAVVPSFLTAMSDALAHDSVSERDACALLASVSVRLHG